MKRLNVTQGSAEWKALRAQYPCASEAPIIMGASRHMTRGELLRLKAAGMEREFSDYVQRMVLDKGHEVEGPARAITERQIGEKLYPITALDDTGEYLASLDGCTMAEDWLMEHKQWNEELASAIRAGATEFPDGQEWQLEQQLMVAQDAEGVIFVCSDGTEERRVQMEYRRVPGRAEQLKAGWKQFFHDLEHGDHTPAPPKAVAAPVEALPMVQVSVGGNLTVTSNLDAFGKALTAFIDRIPAKPSTDQEFADTDAACKALKKAEDALESEEARALASMADVEQLRNLVAKLRKIARDTRLQREKLVEARKLEIRTEEINRGKAELAKCIAGHNAAIGKPYMPAIQVDFAAAIKGLRTVQSVRDAIDQALARAKIAAAEIADTIQTNMRTLRELAADHAFLFADAATLVQKAPDDCRAVITSRIAEHKAEHERKLEAERARIRQEEEARARAQAEREQRERAEAEARQRREEEQERQRQQAADLAEKEHLTRAEPPLSQVAASLPVAQTVGVQTAAGVQVVAADNVVPMPTKAPSAAPTLRLGEINRRIAPLSIDANGLAALGFPPVGRDGAAKLYREENYPAMVDQMVAALVRSKLKQQEAA